jgi:hypothetical protein
MDMSNNPQRPSDDSPDASGGDMAADPTHTGWVSFPTADFAGASFSIVCGAGFGLSYSGGVPSALSTDIPPFDEMARLVDFREPKSWSVVRPGDLLILDNCQMLVLGPIEGSTLNYVRMGPGADCSFASLDTEKFPIEKIRGVAGIKQSGIRYALTEDLARIPLDRQDLVLDNARLLIERAGEISNFITGSIFTSMVSGVPCQIFSRQIHVEKGTLLAADFSLDEPEKYRPISFHLRASADPAECFIEHWDDGTIPAGYDFGERDPLAGFSIDSTQFGERRPIQQDDDPEFSESFDALDVGDEPLEFEVSGWKDRDDDEMELGPSRLASAGPRDDSMDPPSLSPRIVSSLDLSVEIANHFIQIRGLLDRRNRN